MEIKQQVVVFDAADIAAESSFWAEVLGGAVKGDDDWHSVLDGQTRVGVQHAPDHVPPEWPDGEQQQIHLDLYVEDIRSSHDEVLELGARELKAAYAFDAPEGFRVYADPAGHPFCLCW
ncbi:VOC family protein [Tessaracoccus rhinocerotis]|uniref:VOC family protein n=1 Tax=Tessaracoccus rhinocerotis TaxID=1689449 RepID=A0A553K4F7_9ACTN|nr:VOC family protein [Tessaracoccus rhinocerotis]TRY19585.1 VOC family protein [Tessaracoccus rhinocerotis]